MEVQGNVPLIMKKFSLYLEDELLSRKEMIRPLLKSK